MGKKRYFMPVQPRHRDALNQLRKLTRRSMTQEAQLAIEAHLQRYGLWSDEDTASLTQVAEPLKKQGE